MMKAGGRWRSMAALGLMLLFSGAARAADVTNYVATSNGGTANGLSWATAWTDIQSAVDNLGDGDVICVATGTYSVASAQVDINNKDLTIRGGYEGSGGPPGPRSDDANLTVLDAVNTSGRRCMLVQGGADVVLDGLSLIRGNIGSSDGGGLYANASTVLLTNCVVRNNASDARSGAGIWYVGGATVTIKNCELIDNNGPAVGGSGTLGDTVLINCVIAGNSDTYGALYVDPGDSMTLTNCLLRNNYPRAVYVVNNDVVKIYNCTFEGNVSYAVQGGGAATEIKNSIFWNNRDDIIGTVTLSYSCVQDADAGVGVIHDDPLFVSGYYLGVGSPCTNTGTGQASDYGLYSQTAAADSGVVDMGYHYPEAFAPDPAELFVKTNGNNGAAGTAWGTAYKTITHALSQADVGTKIYIASGTYNTALGETFSLNMGDSVQLLGTNAETTVIDAAGSGTRVMTVSLAGRHNHK